MSELNPEQLIKKAILLEVVKYDTDLKLELEDWDEEISVPITFTVDTIDDDYDSFKELHDCVYDTENELRYNGEETGLTTQSSRHYDCHEVGYCIDGVWVGWTYWCGGGRYGEPESIDWMNKAYFLDVKEEEKLVTVREFSKK